jgi:Tfp pilus assembly protein FimT
MRRSSSRPRNNQAGSSIVELVISLIIMLILTAIAIPTLMKPLRAYELNGAAARVADLLKFTRLEAVRMNTQLNFLLQWNGTAWVVGTDSNGNGQIDPTERQEIITGFATLLPSEGLPSPTSITTALGVATLTTLSGNPGSVASVNFDGRGAVRVGGTITTDLSVIYIGSAAHPEFGYRAVVVVPAGGTQVWSAPPGGTTWLRIS